MSAGDRRERIRIERRARTKRPDGGFNVAASVLAERWAAVKPVRASEGEQAGRKRGTVTYLIEVDSRGTDVTTDDVLVWLTNQNIEMNVREVRLPPGRNLPLVLVAESGVVVSG